MKSEARHPLIGIPCRHDTSGKYQGSPINAQSEAYLTAIGNAGGIPFLIPLGLAEPALRKLYDLADGILLSGGGDIEPSLYKHAPHPSESDVQPDRDALEIMLCRWAAENRKPLLAICRGIQVMAIAANGTLIQDLPSQMPQADKHNHRYLDENGHKIEDLVHSIQLETGSTLNQILGTNRLTVNSMHHQAVEHMPEPYTVVARSSDGVVEAVELSGHPFFCGLQWHPEVLTERQEAARQIFRAFIAAC